jgi:hypothetical protein
LGCHFYYLAAMTLHIHYQKNKVIQALRYHFLSRSEIKVMLIAVNIFAIISAALFFFKQISPFAFLVSSFLWFMLMITFWFVLPYMIYSRSATFKDEISITFRADDLLLETGRGYTYWGYDKFKYYMESPLFFHLYINDKSFFLVPKDACTAESDTADVRKVLDEKIGRR